MREILNYPQMNVEKLERVKALIDSIAESDVDCANALNELGCITGKAHDAVEFAEYWGWTDLDSLAEKTLTPEPPCVRDLKRDEVVEIVKIIKEGLIMDDSKADYYMELLHRSLPLPDVIGYVMSEEDAEEIADKMLEGGSGSVILL